jgi:2-C-methyl-D-erythritol 2,4-cyclodiphosphate synthase
MRMYKYNSFGEYRVGIGYDIHRFGKGRGLVLGGVKIPYKLGLVGHSDADVLLHAISDAILGALGLNDIGYYFPPTDERWRGVSSKKILLKAKELLLEHGFDIMNIDTIIIAEKPKIAPYVPEMKKIISSILGIGEGCISVKATTNENIGIIGKNLGIAAFAIVLIKKKIIK